MTLEAVLDGQRIHHRGEHAHVVGGTAFHAAGRPGHAAEDVARADDQGQIDAQRPDGADLLGEESDHGGADAVGAVAHQSLAADLQQYSLEFHRSASRGVIRPSPGTVLRAVLADRFRRRSISRSGTGRTF